MKIQESGEMYLETILILHQKNELVRSIDLANTLRFSKPSISRAMNVLKASEYIIIEKNGNIVLTNKGKEKASQIYERHILIAKYLMITLGVDEDTANQDACRIEHIISQTSFEKIKKFVSSH